ncbi:MAG: hypothetical protein EKK43_06335 [Methylobacterium sp.]|nr:MAG: hypothetical protein EKK43_06335 [Methylobacterium sp.]
MSRKEFDRFVKRKNEEQAELAMDTGKQLEEWHEYLDQLYVMAKEFLALYIDAGSVKIDYKPVSINEEFSGPYDALSMLVYIGTSVVEFKPIGTMLIGSKGRVDVVGPSGTARLSLVKKNVEHAGDLIKVSIILANRDQPPPETKPKNDPAQIEWAWKIMTPPPEMKFIPLTEDTFLDMLLGVAGD